MIADKEHHELNNIMGPIVTFFNLLDVYKKEEDREKGELLLEYLKDAHDTVKDAMPRILEILKGPEHIEDYVVYDEDHKNELIEKEKG